MTLPWSIKNASDRTRYLIALSVLLGAAGVVAIAALTIASNARYYDRSNAYAAATNHRGGDCYETAYQANARRELLLLIHRADDNRLSPRETIRLRRTLRQIELPPCESLLQRISPQLQPASQAPLP